MITLALSQVVWGIAFGWRSLTGGDDGLPEVPRPTLPLPWSMADSTPFYYFVLFFVVLGTLCSFASSASPFGHALRGIRESETRCWRSATMSGDTSWLPSSSRPCSPDSRAAFTSIYNRFVSPDYVHVARSAEVLLMVILGGAGTLIGPAMGAARSCSWKISSAHTPNAG